GGPPASPPARRVGRARRRAGPRRHPGPPGGGAPGAAGRRGGGAPAGPHGRRRAGPARRRAALGPARMRGGGAARGAAAPARRRGRAHAALDGDRRGDRPHRRHAGRGDRRGGGHTGRAGRTERARRTGRTGRIERARRTGRTERARRTGRAGRIERAGCTGRAGAVRGGGAVTAWDARVDAELAVIRAAGRWRDTRVLASTGPVTGVLDGRPVVTFASNDYLGLTRHPAVLAAAHGALDRWGAGTGASRLVVGTRPLHAELEAELTVWKGTDAALSFPTGFAANLGLLATLGSRGVTILSDELNHASIVDGARLARAQVEVYRHGDLDHLAKLLVEVEGGGGSGLVVTDSAFS